MKDDATEIRVGDRLKGTGGIGVNVQILKIQGDTAKCLLERSGSTKDIKLATLKKAYALIERGPGALALIAVCVAAAGCGAPFTAIEERLILILEAGAWEAPPPEDVSVDRPRPTRHEPDAGRSR